MVSVCFSFPAVKGYQAKNEYFTCMVPLGLLDRILPDNDDEVPAEYRAQRRLNESRIPIIKKYIVDNRNTYVFSALAASIDGEFEFVPSELDSHLGLLKISMEAHLLLNDGQHRKAAILAAIEDDPSLKQETIAVVIFKDRGLQRSQQMFSDLNQHAVITSKSLNALYDSKNECALLGKKIVDSVPFFKKYTDKERDNLGKYSHMLFTLNNFVNSTRKIANRVKSQTDHKNVENYLICYWSQVVDSIEEWRDLEKRELSKKDLRESYILTQGVVILALGLLADYCYGNSSYQTKITKLNKIDWLRSNENDWMGISLKANGRINRTSKGINLTFLKIKQLINLPLKDSEKKELDEAKSPWQRSI